MSLGSTIERFWYSTNPLRWLLFIPSLFFLLLTRAKRFGYRVGWFNQNHFSVPVIVVGNITVGGTGKTPFITYLTKQLIAQGLNVGIVSRGYRSLAPTYPHLVKSDDDVNMLGDETFMQYQRLKVPMAIGSDRSNAVKLLSDKHDLDVIVSDDGLQHYSMSRQFEIVMVDGKRALGNQLILPFGPLREDRARLDTVDLIVQNGGAAWCDVLQTSTTNKLMMSLQPISFVQLTTNREIALDDLNEKAVTAVCGIGNPQRYFDTLKKLCTIDRQIAFADHHNFELRDFEGLETSCIIMTEKDAVKCQQFARDNWYFLKVDASIETQETAELVKTIKRGLAIS